jgi:hypothetical protein
MQKEHFTFDTDRKDVVRAMLQFCSYTNHPAAFIGSNSLFDKMMREPGLETGEDFIAACGTKGNVKLDASARHLAVFETPECTFSIRFERKDAENLREGSWTIIVAGYAHDYARTLLEVIDNVSGQELPVMLLIENQGQPRRFNVSTARDQLASAA